MILVIFVNISKDMFRSTIYYEIKISQVAYNAINSNYKK